MSSRDTLRAFQSHLASRLQEARSSGVAASWLAVQAADARLLFPLNHAGEIFAWTPPKRVPYTQPWFLGVANLRGALSGVVDVAAFVLGGGLPSRGDAAHAQCRLIALNPVLGVNCALRVDRLVGLRSVAAFASSCEAPADSPPYFGHGYTDAEGLLWQEINLQALSRHPLFLSISA